MSDVDVIVNKKLNLERCVTQINKYYLQHPDIEFEQDFLKQDAININLQRICEICIDIANFTIRKKQLGLPKTSAESFQLLYEAGIVQQHQLKLLKGMVAFRNILVHQYTKIDLSIMIDIIENRLEEPVEFAQIILTEFNEQ